VVRLSGLRMRMAVSYVLVTAAAVVLVEGIVVGLLLPRVLASSSNASLAAAARQAGADAKRLSAAAVNMARKMPAGTRGSADRAQPDVSHCRHRWPAGAQTPRRTEGTGCRLGRI
jgi:hypothetical protein